MQKNEYVFQISSEKDLDKCVFPFLKWDRIFFYWDLGSGKTTYARALLRKFFQKPDMLIRSPTYTYYHEYHEQDFPHVYHFDLYRMDNVENFQMIGGIEIANSPHSVMLIEWPQVIENIIKPTKIITIEHSAKSGIRTITVKEV